MRMRRRVDLWDAMAASGLLAMVAGVWLACGHAVGVATGGFFLVLLSVAGATKWDS